MGARTQAKAGAEKQCAGLEEEKVELQSSVDDLTSQLQIMTEERDLARSKEEELFDMLTMKDEELMDTNNGYVYLTERLQEKEEDMEHLQELVQQLRSTNEKLDQRCKELSDEMVGLRCDQKTLRAKLADEERGHKTAQDRYMKMLQEGMVAGTGTATPPTTRPPSGNGGNGAAAP